GLAVDQKFPKLCGDYWCGTIRHPGHGVASRVVCPPMAAGQTLLMGSVSLIRAARGPDLPPVMVAVWRPAELRNFLKGIDVWQWRARHLAYFDMRDIDRGRSPIAPTWKESPSDHQLGPLQIPPGGRRARVDDARGRWSSNSDLVRAG